MNLKKLGVRASLGAIVLASGVLLTDNAPEKIEVIYSKSEFNISQGQAAKSAFYLKYLEGRLDPDKRPEALELLVEKIPEFKDYAKRGLFLGIFDLGTQLTELEDAYYKQQESILSMVPSNNAGRVYSFQEWLLEQPANQGHLMVTATPPLAMHGLGIASFIMVNELYWTTDFVSNESDAVAMPYHELPHLSQTEGKYGDSLSMLPRDLMGMGADQLAMAAVRESDARSKVLKAAKEGRFDLSPEYQKEVVAFLLGDVSTLYVRAGELNPSFKKNVDDIFAQNGLQINERPPLDNEELISYILRPRPQGLEFNIGIGGTTIGHYTIDNARTLSIR
jgi:hypothetical protein